LGWGRHLHRGNYDRGFFLHFCHSCDGRFFDDRGGFFDCWGCLLHDRGGFFDYWSCFFDYWSCFFDGRGGGFFDYRDCLRHTGVFSH
jgi:hypothetical protein